MLRVGRSAASERTTKVAAGLLQTREPKTTTTRDLRKMARQTQQEKENEPENPPRDQRRGSSIVQLDLSLHLYVVDTWRMILNGSI
jgi:hypothetical protein